MTGHEHYLRAEEILAGVAELDRQTPNQAERFSTAIATAHVHATLALAAATKAHGGGTYGVPGWPA